MHSSGMLHLFLLQELILPVFSFVIIFSELVDLGHSGKDAGRQLFAGTDPKPAIMFPPVVTAQWEEQVILYLLST